VAGPASPSPIPVSPPCGPGAGQRVRGLAGVGADAVLTVRPANPIALGTTSQDRRPMENYSQQSCRQAASRNLRCLVKV